MCASTSFSMSVASRRICLRRYGRSPRGTRLQDHTPCRHWQTHTVVVGLRLDGLTAPAVFDGPIDNPTFLRLRRTGVGPDAAPGRCRRARQPGGAQTPGDPRGDRRRRRAAAISSALQSRLQSHRTGLRQVESVSSRGPAAQLRPGLRADRYRHPPLYADRVRATTCDTAGIASLHRYEKRSGARGWRTPRASRELRRRPRLRR